MPTLDNIADTGIFSQGPEGSLRRQFEPVNEESTAREFADAINSRRLSVEDALEYFLSYDEDCSRLVDPDIEDCRPLTNLHVRLWKLIQMDIIPEYQAHFDEVLSKTYINSTEFLNIHPRDRCSKYS